MIHLSTIRLLVEWARWGAAHNIGYPTMSPMFGERCLKSPLFGIGHIPEDVAKVEYAVCRLEWIDREILILRYQRRLTFVEMGVRISRSRWTARDRLRTAENEVHHELQRKASLGSPTSIRFVRFCSTDSDPSSA